MSQPPFGPRNSIKLLAFLIALRTSSFDSPSYETSMSTLHSQCCGSLPQYQTSRNGTFPDFRDSLPSSVAGCELRQMSRVPNSVEYALCGIRVHLSKVSFKVNLHCLDAHIGLGWRYVLVAASDLQLPCLSPALVLSLSSRR